VVCSKERASKALIQRIKKKKKGKKAFYMKEFVTTLR